MTWPDLCAVVILGLLIGCPFLFVWLNRSKP